MGEPNPRTDRAGRIHVGPTWWARVWPWISRGAPILSVAFVPVSILAVLRLPKVLAYPVALVIGWAVLSLLMMVGVALVHRSTVVDPAAHTLTQRPLLWPRGTRIALTSIRAVHADFRTQGTSHIHHVAPGGEEHTLSVAYSGWDSASFDGLRWLQAACGQDVATALGQERARDRIARLEQENRVLARRWGIPWRPEFRNPATFQVACDEQRRMLARERR